MSTDRGGWLREGRSQSSAHAIEKSTPFRASLQRFADHAGERLNEAFGPGFQAEIGTTRNAKAFSTLIDHSGQPAVALYSPTLDQRMAMILGSGAVGLIIAAMFGFEAANDFGPEPAGRMPTALEIRMLREVAEVLSHAFCDAFAPVADFDLASERDEIIEDDRLLGGKDSSTLILPTNIKSPAGQFVVTTLFPHPFLTALNSALARGPAPGAAKLDPIWSSKMEKGVTQANLTLTAVLDEFQMSLSDVSSLKVGHILPLIQEDGQGRVRIESGERGVFICSLGERGGRYALEIEDIIARPLEGPYPASSV